MILHEGQPRRGNAPKKAEDPPKVRYVLEREERPDKAQRNEQPEEDAGSAWTEPEGHIVQIQPEPKLEWLPDGVVQEHEPMVVQGEDPGQYGM